MSAKPSTVKLKQVFILSRTETDNKVTYNMIHHHLVQVQWFRRCLVDRHRDGQPRAGSGGGGRGGGLGSRPSLPQKCTSVWVFFFVYLPFLTFFVCLLFLTTTSTIMNKGTWGGLLKWTAVLSYLKCFVSLGNKRDNLDSQCTRRDPKTTVQMLNFLSFWGLCPTDHPAVRGLCNPPGAWADPGPLPNFGTPPPLPDLVRPCNLSDYAP